MNSRQLELMLQERFQRTKSDLDIRGRKLREAGAMPVGGRGPHAPMIDEVHAAKWLIAIGGAKRAVDAADALNAFSALEAVEGGDQFLGMGNFLDALAGGLTKDGAANVQRVVMWHAPDVDALENLHLPFAEIVWAPVGKPMQTTFYIEGSLRQQLAGKEPYEVTIYGMAESVVFAGGAIREIASRMAADQVMADLSERGDRLAVDHAEVVARLSGRAGR